MEVKRKNIETYISKVAVASILATTMLCTAVCPVNAYQLEVSEEVKQENVKMSLEDAIKIARGTFNINVEGLEFDSYYNESNYGYEDKATWTLRWNTEDYDTEYTMVVDAFTKRVISYELYENSKIDKISKISKYTEEEAKEKALKLIQQIESEKSKSIIYDKEAFENSEVVSKYSSEYDFRFIRTIGEIRFPDNYIDVQINKDTLEVMSYSITWNREEIKPIQVGKNIEDAKKTIGEEVGIELMYMLVKDDNAVIYKRAEGDNKKEKNARLVYVLKDYGKVIDAVTGEVFGGGSDIIFRNTNTKEAAMMDAGGTDTVVLTEEEVKEVDNLKLAITKEVAIKKAFEYLDSSFKLESARISKVDDEYIWRLSFNKYDGNNKYLGNESASVNANTGEITRFYIYNSRNLKDETIKYTYDNAKKTADAFVKKIQPLKYNEVKCEENTNKDKSSRYSFTYTRMYNGVRAPFNYIMVIVDGYTGKVTEYSLTWFDFNDKSNIKIENAIGNEKAYNSLYTLSPLRLKYLNFVKDKKLTIRLVYDLSYNENVIIDAVDGKCLDRNLKEIKDEEETTFKDIAGHWAESTVKLLEKYDVIETEEYFRPSEICIQKDVIKMILRGLYSTNTYDNMKDEDYYRLAVKLGILEEKDIAMDKQLTRLDVAKLVVCALGYKKLVMPTSNNYDSSMFTSKYYDVNVQDRGICATVNALGIMKGNGKYFRTNVMITRAEVATIALNMMKEQN